VKLRKVYDGEKEDKLEGGGKTKVKVGVDKWVALSFTGTALGKVRSNIQRWDTCTRALTHRKVEAPSLLGAGIAQCYSGGSISGKGWEFFSYPVS
jgi:hypothetical protein